MAYATYEDLQARWRTLTEAEQATATTLLEDAAGIIDAAVTIDTEDTTQLANARYVSCAMVRRSMQASESDMIGISQASATMGPFSQQATFANPTGELYLTAQEKAMLGASSSFVGSLRAKIGGYYGAN